jgi:hypothetical protein
VVHVYGDDGADEKREKAISVAVVGGLEEMWQELEEKWIARCNGIPFHAKDCESDRGEYEGMPHELNKATYRDLTTLLAASRVGGIAIAIDIVAQRKIFPNALRIAYYRAFAETVERAASLAEYAGEVAELTFDISTENEYNARLIYSSIRESDARLARWLHPRISFVSARHSPRIQTADLLAYEAWKALDHTVGEVKRKRGSWMALRETKRFETISYTEEWFSDLRKHIQSGEAEKVAGFNEDCYKKWLLGRNRQHNLSNLFTFIGLQDKKGSGD